MDKITELAVITMEECAELTQELSKRLRFPDDCNDEEWRRRITKEAADVACMLQLLVDNDLVHEDGFALGIKQKENKLRKWSNLFPSPVPSSLSYRDVDSTTTPQKNG